MAKYDSVSEFSGTLKDVTYVDSKRYGPYARAPRGTHKPALINDKLKENVEKVTAANVPAKIIQDALAPYRENFKGGQMWQRLVSIFTAQQGRYDFKALENFEIYEEFTLGSHMSLNTDVSINIEKQVMDIKLTYERHPQFIKAKHVTGYTLQAAVVFAGKTTHTTKVRDAITPVISMESALEPQRLQVEIPAQSEVAGDQPASTTHNTGLRGATAGNAGNGAVYLVCVKLEGWDDRFIMKGMTTKGMRVERVSGL